MKKSIISPFLPSFRCPKGPPRDVLKTGQWPDFLPSSESFSSPPRRVTRAGGAGHIQRTGEMGAGHLAGFHARGMALLSPSPPTPPMPCAGEGWGLRGGGDCGKGGGSCSSRSWSPLTTSCPGMALLLCLLSRSPRGHPGPSDNVSLGADRFLPTFKTEQPSG